MKWEKVNLGSIITLEYGKPLVKEDRKEFGPFKVYASGGHVGNHDKSFITTPTIIVGRKGSIGSITYSNDPCWVIDTAYYVKLKENICLRYLFYGLSQLNLASLNKAAAVPGLNRNDVYEKKIPLPPLHIQEQIADTLDRADALRRKDQELLQKYDQLAQAIFYDMFGDPVRNDRGWEIKMFSEVGSLDRGVSKHRPRNAPELLGGKYPLIQTGDVSNCRGFIKNYTQTYSEAGFKQSKLWPKGTLCITIAANIAKTGILDFDACFPDSVVGFIPNNLVQINYVRFWLSHLQKSLEDSAPESAQKNINLDILRKLKIPVPPKALQDQFENVISAIRKNHELSNQNTEKSKTLFDALIENKML